MPLLHLSILPRSQTAKSGFTIIELLVTLSVFATLATFISINLINPQKKSSIDTQVQTVISDIKSQQIKSMLGATNGQPASQKHGVYFTQNNYVLFSGNSYNPLDSSNFEVTLEGDVQISTTLPLSTLLFEKISGEVTSFTNGQNTITFTNPTDNQNKTFSVNYLGSVSVN